MSPLWCQLDTCLFSIVDEQNRHAVALTAAAGRFDLITGTSEMPYSTSIIQDLFSDRLDAHLHECLVENLFDVCSSA